MDVDVLRDARGQPNIDPFIFAVAGGWGSGSMRERSPGIWEISVEAYAAP
jgi:hypothetical protein